MAESVVREGGADSLLAADQAFLRELGEDTAFSWNSAKDILRRIVGVACHFQLLQHRGIAIEGREHQ